MSAMIIHTEKATQGFVKAKKWDSLHCQPPDLNPNEPKDKLKAPEVTQSQWPAILKCINLQEK